MSIAIIESNHCLPAPTLDIVSLLLNIVLALANVDVEKNKIRVWGPKHCEEWGSRDEVESRRQKVFADDEIDRV